MSDCPICPYREFDMCPKKLNPAIPCRDCLFWDCFPCDGCILSEKCLTRKGDYIGV